MWLRRACSRRGVLLIAIAVVFGGWLATIANGLSAARHQIVVDLSAVREESSRGERAVTIPARGRTRPVSPVEAAPMDLSAVHEPVVAAPTEAVAAMRDAGAENPALAELLNDADPDVRDALAAFVAGLDGR